MFFITLCDVLGKRVPNQKQLYTSLYKGSYVNVVTWQQGKEAGRMYRGKQKMKIKELQENSDKKVGRKTAL